MIYVAFAVWLLLIIFAGLGVYRLWTALLKPAIVDWALLPGTIVSEMAYIFGCLITGGEVKRAKLMDSGSGKPAAGGGKTAGGASGGGGAAGGSGTQATPKFKFIGPAIASLLAIVACGAGLFALYYYLGKQVVFTFHAGLIAHPSAELSKTLPVSWPEFWDQLRGQVNLLRHMCETLPRLRWSDWHTGVFVYLAACLAIRMAPAKRDLRAMLVAAILVAGGIAAAGAISPSAFGATLTNLWPLLTYVWASLLFLLTATLLLRGLIGLGMILAGKGPKAKA